jgi:hypothetical protein
LVKTKGKNLIEIPSPEQSEASAKKRYFRDIGEVLLGKRNRQQIEKKLHHPCAASETKENAITAAVAKVRVDLHYGNYRSKLVPFEEQKNIFFILKRL